MINRILPFLSQFIPGALAVKGLSKVDPRLSKFFSNAAAAGYGTDAALNFLKNKLTPSASAGEQQRLQQGSEQGTLRPDEAASLQNIRQSQAPTNAIQKGVSALTGIGAGMVTDQPSPQEPQQQGKTQQQIMDPMQALQEFPELIQFIQQEQSRGENAASIASKARKSVRLGTFVNVLEQKAGEAFENMLARLIGQGEGQQGMPSSQQGNQADTAILAALDKILKM